MGLTKDPRGEYTAYEEEMIEHTCEKGTIKRRVLSLPKEVKIITLNFYNHAQVRRFSVEVDMVEVDGKAHQDFSSDSSLATTSIADEVGKN